MDIVIAVLLAVVTYFLVGRWIDKRKSRKSPPDDMEV